jgi:hypothetical protein
MHRQNVRMIKSASRFDFVPESPGVGIAPVTGERRGQNFQRNSPIQVRLKCGIDHTHAASAQFTLEPIAGKRADAGRRRLVLVESVLRQPVGVHFGRISRRFLLAARVRMTPKTTRAEPRRVSG